MSGPIVRKYGFPNYDQIFGARPLEHGAEAEEELDVAPAAERKSASRPTKKPSTKKKSDGAKKA
jgi:hypothetical protein